MMVVINQSKVPPLSLTSQSIINIVLLLKNVCVYVWVDSHSRQVMTKLPLSKAAHRSGHMCSLLPPSVFKCVFHCSDWLKTEKGQIRLCLKKHRSGKIVFDTCNQ